MIYWLFMCLFPRNFTFNFISAKRFLLFALGVFLIFSSFEKISAQEDEPGEDAQAQAVAKFNEGQDAHEKGDLQTALKLYDEAVKLAPEFPEVEFQRGNIFISLNKPNEAEKAFRRAIELREDWTLPMASLGGLLVDKNEFAEAERILTKAVELDDNNFPAYVALTDLRLKTKAAPPVLKELLTKLQTLTSKANPTASVWAARGALEFALNDKPSARKSLTNALAIEPKNAFALQTRAEISMAESDFDKALNDAQALVQKFPNSINYKVLLARVYAESGSPADALKILDGLDSANPNVKSLRNSLTASNSENAAELEKQLEKDRNNATILGRLCTLLRVENPPKALEYCRRANEIDPNNINHAVGFGAALVQAKQFENAILVLRRIAQVSPDNFTVRANLATALFELKRYSEAINEYQWLAEKQPKLPITYYFLAISYDNLEQYLDALANYQQFLKFADSNENKLEIEKVNLRLPILQKLAKKVKNKK